MILLFVIVKSLAFVICLEFVLTKLRNNLIALCLLALLVVTISTSSRAATISSASDTLSTVKASTVANHEIYFVSPTGAALNSDIVLTFTGLTTTGVAFGDVDIATGDSGNCSTATFTERTVASSAGAAAWGVSNSNPAITLSTPTSGAGALSAGNCIRIKIGTNASTGTAGTNQITNGTAGLKTITINGSFGDSGDISVYLLADDGVAVSASVIQSISFSISDNTIGFGDLTIANNRYANGATTGSDSLVTAHNLQAGTNASGGYVITLQGSTLTSGTSTISAIGATNTAIATGTEQFGVRYEASGGDGAVSAPYAASGFAYAATASTTSQIASSTGPSLTTTYNATYIANISPTTESGTYTTALTYVATATY